MMWGTEATSNPTEYWLFEPTTNGFYLKNAATHAYVYTAAQLQSTASRVVTISWPLKMVSPLLTSAQVLIHPSTLVVIIKVMAFQVL